MAGREPSTRPTAIESRPVWLARAGAHGEDEDAALDLALAIIGFHDIPSLHGLRAVDEIVEKVRRVNPTAKEANIRNRAGQLEGFAIQMQKGDIVALPLKTRPSQIALGRVTGEYAFREVLGKFRHTRPVEWVRPEAPRNAFEQDLLFSLGAFLTVCRIRRHDAERRIAAVLAGGEDPGFDSAAQPTSGEAAPEEMQPQALPDVTLAAHDQIVAHEPGLAQPRRHRQWGDPEAPGQSTHAVEIPRLVGGTSSHGLPVRGFRNQSVARGGLREALYFGPVARRSPFPDRGDFLVASREHHMHEFVEECERSRLRHLFAVDGDDRERCAEKSEPAHLFEAHAGQEEHKHAHLLDGRPPSGPCPPLVRPSELGLEVNTGRLPQARTNLGSRFTQLGPKREASCGLAEFLHKVQGVLAARQHLAKCDAQPERLSTRFDTR